MCADMQQEVCEIFVTNRDISLTTDTEIKQFIYFVYSLISITFSSTFRIDHTKIINTFAASYLNTQGLNNSCLKSRQLRP